MGGEGTGGGEGKPYRRGQGQSTLRVAFGHLRAMAAAVSAVSPAAPSTRDGQCRGECLSLPSGRGAPCERVDPKPGSVSASLIFIVCRSLCAMARVVRIGARCCLREWERSSSTIWRRCEVCIARTLPRAMGECCFRMHSGGSIPMHRWNGAGNGCFRNNIARTAPTSVSRGAITWTPA